MADFFGSEQNRVLNVKDRNLDNVVFQYKHPPLTSEWNLINQIGNEKIQNLAKMSLPSGWLAVDNLYQDLPEVDARTGCVLCSNGYDANSFKLASLNNNIAIVNGWPILIQGTECLDNNNVIRLSEPNSQTYDFVFLEVWRKLVATDGEIYPYGNVLASPYYDNEIEWPAIGCETTKRVQIQYRIRSKSLSMSITDVTKEIFDLTDIYPIGGRINGEAVSQKFSVSGTTDPGLYTAGDGSESSKTYLNTVDGFVYAIPMFIIYRRRLSNSDFVSTTIHSTKVTKDMQVAGYRSDRPDKKMAHIIYKDDIVDLRHKVIVSGDIKDIVDTSISKLIAGELATVLKKGFGEDGFISPPSSGGNTLMKVERINSVSGDNIPDVGFGSGTQGQVFKRRSFCNAEVTHDHNIIEISYNGSGVWLPGSFTIASKVTLPDGEIVSVDGFYSPDQGLVSGVTSDGTSITIAASGAEHIVGTSVKLIMEFTFKYSSSSLGFKDVPKEFIEVNKNDTVAIATRDKDLQFKVNNSGNLLNFSEASVALGSPGEMDPRDLIKYRGGNYTELSNFGHEVVLYRTTTNSGIVNIPLLDNKYNQYYILGVKSVEVSGVHIPFTSERAVTTSPYSILNYIITVGAYPDTEIVITLYTGSKFIENSGDTYSVADSVKFFELTKQGMGILDTYEMIEVIAEEESPGIYKIDTRDKPIIKLATTAVSSGSFVEGLPFAYLYDISFTHIAINNTLDNSKLPIINGSEYTPDLLPTIMRIEAAPGYVKLRVPVLVHSYVASNESPYNFFYKTVPYQGMLNTTSDQMFGKVQGENTAIISSSGSGAVVNFSYSEGHASLIEDSRTVSGIGTNWGSYVLPNDYLRLPESTQLYRVLNVVSDTEITLCERYKGVSETITGYEITRFDICVGINSNTINRLPALSMLSSDNITDYKCYSDILLNGLDDFETLLTSAKRKLQDPLNASINDFTLGVNSGARRGRNDFRLTIEGNPAFKVGNGRPYVVYTETGYAEPVNTTPSSNGHHKKVYQFYVFVRSGKGYQSDPSLMGKIYLMVIAGETIDANRNYLNPFSDKDTVDIFELVGRPIIRG